ncbi:hypothetical protein VRK_20010 [Vibrio sp. MEBiC08052]|nr:hypothetical protein VRK_20010 [Vibrio sp. MEBiC08052]
MFFLIYIYVIKNIDDLSRLSFTAETGLIADRLIIFQLLLFLKAFFFG